MASQVFLTQINETITPEGVDLIQEFFITFSRFEYALKVSGFAEGNANGVSPNWDKFTASIRSAFEDDNPTEKILNAINYFSHHSPKIQNYENNQLGWRERVFQVNEPLINRLSLSIRDVRNNLFHGGKFNGNYQEDSSRNFLLLKYSIEILNYWLMLKPEVRSIFLQPID